MIDAPPSMFLSLHLVSVIQCSVLCTSSSLTKDHDELFLFFPPFFFFFDC